MRSEQDIFGEDLSKTDLSVGQILRRAREHYGRTLEECSNALRIRAQQLEAIEKEEWYRLPGKVYAIGFVRSYAEYLDLDGEKMVRLLKMQSDGVGLFSPRLSLPGQQSSDNRGPGIWAITLSLMFIALAIFAGTFFNYGKSADGDVAEILSQTYGHPADHDDLAVDLSSYTQNIPIVPLHISDDDIVGFVDNVKKNQHYKNKSSQDEALVNDRDVELSTLPTGYQGNENPSEKRAENIDSGNSEGHATFVDKNQQDSGVLQADKGIDAVDNISTDVDKVKADNKVLVKDVANAHNAQESENLTRKRAKSRIVITAQYDSWVEITALSSSIQGNGREVFARVLRKGDIYYVPEDKGHLRLATGNAGGLLIAVDGKSLGALGKKGDIMRGVDLEPAALIKRLK